MEDKYFLTQVQRRNGTYNKGVVVHDSFDAAKQGFHAYLGAYGYGHDAEVDFVACAVMDSNGYVEPVEVDDRRPSDE